MLQELLPANLIPVLEAEEWKQVTFVCWTLITYLCIILLILLCVYCNVVIISCNVFLMA